MSESRLIYLPLGGAGEIGMNAYVYGQGADEKERLILVDLGVTFPDMDTTPGVDLILPDIAWLEARKTRLEAIFITHAHEDHIGALARLWSRLEVPVYARAFTAHIARLKMEEAGLDPTVVKTVSGWPETVTAGPFRVGFAPVSHSIPESSALVIDTGAGRVVHTGDFKLDTNPGVGEPFDESMWQGIAADGVQALVCDSTNVTVGHPGRSESDIGADIRDLIAAAPGLVAATTFASNIARLKTLAEAARDAGRSVCLLGRAMRRMVTAGETVGILPDFPKVVSPEEAVEIPRQNLMLLTSGSQGEHRAATAQLSRGRYMGLELKDGDTFLFSSKTIPGNERGVLRIVNAFSEMGVDVVDDSSSRYHVSGHANRPDLDRFQKLIAPRMVVPMHGEHRHLRLHASLAQENGYPSAVAVNGTMLDLGGDRPVALGHVDAGRIYLDGKVLIGAYDGVVRDRIRVARDGHVTVTLVLEEDEMLGDPWCEIKGLPEVGISDAPLVDVLEEDLSQFIHRADRKTRLDDGKLDDAMRKTVRKTASDEVGKKPEVTVVISRLS